MLVNVLKDRRMVACYVFTLIAVLLVLCVLTAGAIPSPGEADIILDLKELKPNSASPFTPPLGRYSPVKSNRPKAADRFWKKLRALVAAGGAKRERPHLDLGLVHLANRTATCNDGTRAGYYIRRSSQSRWIVFLEGGWFCFDKMSCYSRFHNMRRYMSSVGWAAAKTGHGILSADPLENPYFHNYSVVFVPYCSSDAWTGLRLRKTSDPDDYAFLGSLIITEVLKQLLSSEGLHSASHLLVTGSSAGAVGVMMNIDRINRLIQKEAPQITVRGIADSGWFLDNQPFKPILCTEAFNCAPSESISRGAKYWNGQVPEKCFNLYPTEPWRCYIGYRLYPVIETPTYLVNFMFDEAQIAADSVGPPIRADQWQYIHRIGRQMGRTISNLTYIFAPACVSHMTLTKRDWSLLSIGGVTLPEALSCWLDSDLPTVQYTRSGTYMRDKFELEEGDPWQPKRSPVLLQYPPRSPLFNKGNRMFYGGDFGSGKRQIGNRRNFSGQQHNLHRLRHRKRRRRRRKNRKRRKDQYLNREGRRRLKRSINSGVTPLLLPPSAAAADHSISSRSRNLNKKVSLTPPLPKKCQFRFIDNCAWPQCNPMCPKFFNPFTREEVNFVSLLTQFGLDESSIANALGMDLATFRTMDPNMLFKMLRRQT